MYSEETLYRDYLVDWMKGKRYSISSQTRQVMESYVKNQIVPLLGDFTLAQLNPMVLQQFINQLIDRGLASNSVRRIFSVVHSSLDAAEKMQLISKNYASIVNKPKVRRKELHVWDVEEARDFLQLAAKDRYTYVAFHLALLTGMRQGEILGLRWIDVDLESRLLFVRQTISHDGKEFLSGAKTLSGVRSIALDQETAAILTKHRLLVLEDKERLGAKYQDSGLVVCTRTGGKTDPRTLMKVWYQLLRASGLPKITFHDLRHTHASLLLKNNVHPKIVSERLGHSSIQITLDTYSHLLPNMQRDAADKLGESLLWNRPNP